MQRTKIAALALLSLTLAACDQRSAPSAAQPPAREGTLPTPAEPAKPAMNMPAATAPAASGNAATTQPVANASPAEGSSIVVNTVCPVGGDPVDPNDPKLIKVTVDGKTYGMCCQDCVAPFKANPAKYLSKK